MRLPKDGRGGLPRDMTRRRPEVCDGEGRMRRGQRCGEPAGALASPEAGGEADAGTARREAWWSAARCLRRALAAASRGRRRLAGAGGKVVGVVPVEGEDGGDSSRSLMVEMPPFDEIVKVADSPAPPSVLQIT